MRWYSSIFTHSSTVRVSFPLEQSSASPWESQWNIDCAGGAEKGNAYPGFALCLPLHCVKSTVWLKALVKSTPKSTLFNSFLHTLPSPVILDIASQVRKKHIIIKAWTALSKTASTGSFSCELFFCCELESVFMSLYISTVTHRVLLLFVF